MRSNRLQLNTAKTEVLWCATSRRQHQIPQAPVQVGEINRLQSMLNAAAQLVYSSWRYDHVTPLLLELHWLRMSQRIDYKLEVLVYRCPNGPAPSYLTNDL